MRLPRFFFSKRIHLTFKSILILLSLWGTINILISTQNTGIGLTPDSVNYIATARNIAHGNGVTSFDDKPLTIFPPLYSVCLGLIEYIFDADPLKSAVFFNSLLFGFIIYISGLLLYRHLNSSILYSIPGTISIFVGIPLIMVSQLALSESLFICLFVFYLYLSERYTEKGTPTLLVFLALIVALACLTRYIGVILIITGFINIFFSEKNKLLVKARHSFIFAAITIFPITSFLIRNYLITGTFLGYRVSSNSNLLQNFKLSYSTIYSWYVPTRMLFDYSIILILLIIVGILGCWYLLKNKSNFKKFFKNKLILINAIIFYLGFLIISSSIVSYNVIGNRLLSPIFIPVSILLIIFGSKILKLLTDTLPRALKIGVLSSAVFIWYVLWLSQYFHFAIPVFGNSMIREMGYNSISWINNQTIKYIREEVKLDNNYPIYSNDPYALYILTDLKSQITPNYDGLFNGYVSYKKMHYITALKGIWPEKNISYLIWFNQNNYLKHNLYEIDKLDQIADLKQLVQLDDGTIYLINRK